MDASPLDDLAGGELDTVSFVRDYVELRIGYSIVRALTNPTGSIDGDPWSFPSDQSLSLMRRYIGRSLVFAEVREGERILLVFEGNATIEISLRPETVGGPKRRTSCPHEGTARWTRRRCGSGEVA